MNNYSSECINGFYITEARAMVQKESWQCTPWYMSAEATEQLEYWGRGADR